MPKKGLAERGNALKMIQRIVSWASYGFKTFILRKNSPYLFGMVVTDKCNLNCFYCESKNSGRYHFTSDKAEICLRDAYGRGHRSLYFTGGEPMLWTDNKHNLADLTNYARKLGFLDILITTNGTVPLSIKDCTYFVTIDGPKEIHNKIRANSYDLIMRNVQNAATKNIFASITFNKTNFEHAEQFVREITGLNLFKGISFNLLTHCPEIVEKYGVTAEERTQLLDKLWKLKKEGYPIRLSRAAYIALCDNNWKRPIPQIELGTNKKIFTCCRDVNNPSICENCGYVSCVEVSQVFALKPSAIWEILKWLTGAFRKSSKILNSDKRING